MSNNSDVTDQQLATEIRVSNNEAFDELYLRYYKKLFYFFATRTNSEDIARDLVQDVFTRIWVYRENIDPEKSIKAYLYKTAHSVIINYFKKKKVIEVATRELLYIETETEISDVFDLENNIADLIKKLPPDLRQVFLLSRVEYLKYSEIAERLDISIKKVERQMSKALNLLRKAYNQLFC